LTGEVDARETIVRGEFGPDLDFVAAGRVDPGGVDGWGDGEGPVVPRTFGVVEDDLLVEIVERVHAK